MLQQTLDRFDRELLERWKAEEEAEERALAEAEEAESLERERAAMAEEEERSKQVELKVKDIKVTDRTTVCGWLRSDVVQLMELLLGKLEEPELLDRLSYSSVLLMSF